MLVKAHDNPWFRDCIISYLDRTYQVHNYNLETNQVIFNKLFSHLNSLDEDHKAIRLQNLRNLIESS